MRTLDRGRQALAGGWPGRRHRPRGRSDPRSAPAGSSAATPASAAAAPAAGRRSVRRPRTPVGSSRRRCRSRAARPVIASTVARSCARTGGWRRSLFSTRVPMRSSVSFGGGLQDRQRSPVTQVIRCHQHVDPGCLGALCGLHDPFAPTFTGIQRQAESEWASLRSCGHGAAASARPVTTKCVRQSSSALSLAGRVADGHRFGASACRAVVNVTGDADPPAVAWDRDRRGRIDEQLDGDLLESCPRRRSPNSARGTTTTAPLNLSVVGQAVVPWCWEPA